MTMRPSLGVWGLLRRRCTLTRRAPAKLLDIAANFINPQHSCRRSQLLPITTGSGFREALYLMGCSGYSRTLGFIVKTWFSVQKKRKEKKKRRESRIKILYVGKHIYFRIRILLISVSFTSIRIPYWIPVSVSDKIPLLLLHCPSEIESTLLKKAAKLLKSLYVVGNEELDNEILIILRIAWRKILCLPETINSFFFISISA